MTSGPAAPVAPGAGPVPGLIVLDRSECLELLRTVQIGRVVVPVGPSARPVIRPVHFAFDAVSQSVVFRSLPGGKLYALLHSSRAVFEVDGADPHADSMWSVIIEGAVEAVRDPMELRRLGRLELVERFTGAETRWMRIRARTVSGRRLMSG